MLSAIHRVHYLPHVRGSPNYEHSVALIVGPTINVGSASRGIYKILNTQIFFLFYLTLAYILPPSGEGRKAEILNFKVDHASI